MCSETLKSIKLAHCMTHFTRHSKYLHPQNISPQAEASQHRQEMDRESRQSGDLGTEEEESLVTGL